MNLNWLALSKHLSLRVTIIAGYSVNSRLRPSRESMEWCQEFVPGLSPRFDSGSAKRNISLLYWKLVCWLVQNVLTFVLWNIHRNATLTSTSHFARKLFGRTRCTSLMKVSTFYGYTIIKILIELQHFSIIGRDGSNLPNLTLRISSSLLEEGFFFFAKSSEFSKI